MKKIIILSGIVILLLAVAYFLFFNRPALNSVLNGGQSPDEEPSVATTTQTEVGDIKKDVPSEPTFYISAKGGLVKVNNFYLNNPEVLEADVIGLYSDAAYSIMYSIDSSVFWINYENSPDSRLRIEAENAFLKLLGIAKEDACRLEAWETVGSAPRKISLSFCGVLAQ